MWEAMGLYICCKIILIALLCISGGLCEAVGFMPGPIPITRASEAPHEAVTPCPSSTETPEIIWQYDLPATDAYELPTSGAAAEPAEFDDDTSCEILKDALAALEWEDKRIAFLVEDLKTAGLQGVRDAHIMEIDECGDADLYLETTDVRRYRLVLLNADMRVGGIIDFETGETVFVFLP